MLFVAALPVIKRYSQSLESKDLRRKRVRGIEPLSLAWKAKVLPLNYTRRWIGYFRLKLD
jgi:hypothetical protein